MHHEVKENATLQEVQVTSDDKKNKDKNFELSTQSQKECEKNKIKVDMFQTYDCTKLGQCVCNLCLRRRFYRNAEIHAYSMAAYVGCTL